MFIFSYGLSEWFEINQIEWGHLECPTYLLLTSSKLSLDLGKVYTHQKWISYDRQIFPNVPSPSTSFLPEKSHLVESFVRGSAEIFSFRTCVHLKNFLYFLFVELDLLLHGYPTQYSEKRQESFTSALNFLRGSLFFISQKGFGYAKSVTYSRLLRTWFYKGKMRSCINILLHFFSLISKATVLCP